MVWATVLALDRRTWGFLMGPVCGLSRVVAGSSRSTRRGAAVLGVALALGLATASPAAASVWTAAANVSEEGQSAYGPQVAVDAAGEATVVWTRYNGSNDVVQAAVKPAGEPWGQPATLSKAGQEASEPQVAVDAAGDATVVWRRFNGSNYIVQAAVRPAGAPWGNSATLSEAGQNASDPHIAVDTAGDAIAVWTRYNGSNGVVQAAVKPAGEPWGTTTTVSEAGQEASEPQVAVDAAGDASAVWTRYNGFYGGQGNYVVQDAVKPAGEPWGEPATLSEESQDEGLEPRLAVDAAGDATAVWKRFIYGCCRLVQAAVKPVGEPWGTTTTLEAGGDPRVGVDAAGDATAVWTGYYGPGDVVRAAVKPAGEPWGTTATISEDEVLFGPEVTVNAAGEATAVWTRYIGFGYGHFIVQAAQYSSSTAFTIETLQKLSTESTYTSNELTGEVGDTVDYEVIVKNTGDTSLKFGALKDSGCENISPGGATELEASKEETFTCTHELTGLVKYGNEASIIGNEGTGTKTSNRVTVNGRESAPTYVSSTYEEVTSDSATFTAVLDPNGLHTQVDFFVSHANSQAFEYDELVPASNEDQTVHVHVGGMTSGCTYRLEVEAFNNDGSTPREYVGAIHTTGKHHKQCNLPVERERPGIYERRASDINSHKGLLEATIDPDGERSTYEFLLYYQACQGAGCPPESEAHSVVAGGVIKAGYGLVKVKARPRVKPGCEYAFGLSTSNALGTNALEDWWEGPWFTTYAEGLTEAHSCTP